MKDYAREINGIRHVLLGEKDADQAADVAAQVFTDGSEPITRALRVTPEDFRRFVQAFCPKFTREALSVIARDVATGEPVGVQLNDDMGTELPGISGGFGSLEPAMALLTELDHRHFGERALEVNCYAHLFFIAVRAKYRRRGICRGLLDMSLEIARDRGYRWAIAEATGLFSQHVLRKAGFKPRAEVPYSTFEFNGTRPFQSIEDHPSLMLMESELGNAR